MINTLVTTLTNRQECAELLHRLIKRAERQVRIFSQQLEPVLYNHQHICDLLSELARKNRHTGIRILAQQTRSVASEGHCLIQLAQRLSSSVQIRIPSTPELLRFRQSWLIIDNHSIMLIDNPDRYQGSAVENNRLYVKTKLEFFDHAWENSQPDQNTRQLNI